MRGGEEVKNNSGKEKETGVNNKMQQCHVKLCQGTLTPFTRSTTKKINL